MPPVKALGLILSLFLTTSVLAQSPSLYTYQDLSHFYYSKQKDSLKKAWACPDAFKDKAAQKKYKEIWDSRTDAITANITADNYVHDKEIGDYIQTLVHQITSANKSMFPDNPLVMIDRDPSVNAYSVGGNFLAVNLGLVAWCQSREEMALVLAHELSHNALHHIETLMYERAQWLTSDEYKQSLNAVLDSKYERLSRLKKVIENYSFSRSRHQRYHESDADSLAVILLKNANIPFNAAFFLRLDSSDMEYHQPLAHPLKEYFTVYQLPYEDAWAQKRSHGLSTRAYSFSENTTLADSLKTHPDCEIRYAKLKGQSTPNPRFTPIPAGIHDRATKMLIWNMYSSNLTPCLYRILLIKDQGNKDPWYDFMLSNVFSGLYYADHKLARFNAIGVMQKEYISKEYYGLQTMLEQIPRDNLKQYCQGLQDQAFWHALPAQERGLKDLFYAITLDPDDSESHISKVAKEFASANGSSLYCEFAHNFEK